jgi:hypothetical protein
MHALLKKNVTIGNKAGHLRYFLAHYLNGVRLRRLPIYVKSVFFSEKCVSLKNTQLRVRSDPLRSLSGAPGAGGAPAYLRGAS